MLYDTHTHTSNSIDGHDTVDALCEKAEELKLTALAITEHCEANRFYKREHYGTVDKNDEVGYNFGESALHAFEDNTRAKEKYAGRVNVLCGLELGQGNADIEASEKLLIDSRLDYVIGSMHEMPGYPDFYWIDYSKYNIDELMEKNFKAVYDMCVWGGFDTLGHLTYAMRYIMKAGFTADLSKHNEMIHAILEQLAKKDKGLEINTSGLRQGAGMTFPTVEYVKAFRQAGGKIVTIGSDSHCTADLAKGVADGIEVARAAGFTEAAYFVKRSPVFVKI